MPTSSSTPPRIEGLPEDAAAAMVGGPGDFVDHIGLVIDLVSPTRVEAHLDVGDTHHQPYGIVHGGVHASIVETLASVGAAANVVDRGMGVVGLANSTDFIRAIRDGRILAVAEPVHTGRTQQLWVVTITRERDGKLVARGQVRLQVVDPDML